MTKSNTTTTNKGTSNKAEKIKQAPVHINKVTLMGSLEEAPKINRTESGSRAFIRLATVEFFVDDKGDLQPISNWHSLVTFNETLVKKVEGLKPGATLYIEGRNRSGKYERDGNTQYTYEVQAQTITVL